MPTLINPFAFKYSPDSAISFNAAGGDYLSMSIGNFGAYDYSKFSISIWARPTSASTVNPMVSHENATLLRNTLYFTNTGKLQWRTFDGSFRDTITTATIANPAAYVHILASYDASAGTGLKKRIWVDGTEITSFSTNNEPTGNVSAPDTILVGRAEGLSTFDGLLYQTAFFSGRNPDISEVYNAGKLDLQVVPDVRSIMNVAGGVVTTDTFLATAWTIAAGAPVASSTIPA